MKYNVRYYENQRWNSEICGSKEETIAFVQKLRVSWKISKLRIKITPHIEPYTIVFNKESYETRLVESVDERLEIVTVYDTDDMELLSDPRMRHMLKTREKWPKAECVPVDVEKLKESGFKFGSSMGRITEALSIYHEWGIFE